MASIYDFLEGCAAEDMNALYSNTWACLAVFQSLPPLAQQVVLRLLSAPRFVTVEALHAWVREGGAARVDAVVAKLKALHIMGARVPAPGTTVTAAGPDGDVVVSAGEARALALQVDFKRSLEAVLGAGEGMPWLEVTHSLPPLRKTPSVDEIEASAAETWNSILHYLVGSADAPLPKEHVVELLVSTGLLAVGAVGEAELLDGAGGIEELNGAAAGAAGGAGSAPLSFAAIMAAGGGAVHITRAGYEFLMKDTAYQLWTFMSAYLATAAARGMRVVDILGFLFQLGFCRLGDGYGIAALSDVQRGLIKDLMALGLIYVPAGQQAKLSPEERAAMAAGAPQPDRRRFFPTSLAIVLTQPGTTADSIHRVLAASKASRAASSAGGGAQGGVRGAPGAGDAASVALEDGKLYVVVERNYRLYAYTSVDLHVALLSLFAKIEVRLPNLIVARLTRGAMQAAFEKGIRASSVTGFLAARAHPAVAARGLAVPQNVSDQLELWERERHRAVFTSGVVSLHSFANDAVFSSCAAHLAAVNGIVLLNPAARIMIIKATAYDYAKRVLRGDPTLPPLPAPSGGGGGAAGAADADGAAVAAAAAAAGGMDAAADEFADDDAPLLD